MAGLVVLLGAGWLGYHTTTRFIATEDWVAHTQEVITELETVSATLADVETEQRGYLLTDSPDFLRDRQAAAQQLPGQLQRLRGLTADNPAQQRDLGRLEPLITQRLSLLDERIAVFQQHGLETAADVTAMLKGKAAMDRVRGVIAEMLSTERGLLIQREQLSRESARWSLAIIATGSLLACLLAGAAFVILHRDFQLRAKVEMERDRFFTLSRDLLCIAGFDGYFKRLNPAWEQTLGYTAEELLASPFLDFVHPDDIAATQAKSSELSTGGEVIHFENRYRCKDGSYRWFAWNARADPAGKMIYASARDVTEQKQAEERIRALNEDLKHHAEQLERANKELEAFSYSVSHDLRAPLRHIDGFVKILEKQSGLSLDERGRRYLSIIADSARQMGALIDDLLVFSRMSRTDLRCSKVAQNSLVHEAVNALQTETHGRRIIWKIGELPEVEADPAMLRQVWINLVSNAVKYTRPRNPAEIEVGSTDTSNGEFVCFVRDNGVGFDMQYAHKLFGVFQRLHRVEEFEGTGIGLANVRRIISRHGGRTWAEGKPDGGATFYFSLPKTTNEPKG